METDQLTMEKKVVTATSLWKNKSGRYTIIGPDYILRIFKSGANLLKLEPGVHEGEVKEIMRDGEKCSLHEIVALYDKVDKEINDIVESMNPFRQATKPTVKIKSFYVGNNELLVTLEKNDFELPLNEIDFWDWAQENEYNVSEEPGYKLPPNDLRSKFYKDWETFSKEEDLMKLALENYLTEKIG